MAEPASLFDLVDEDAKRAAVEKGLADADAGRVVSHERVVEWLDKLAKGERLPPPVSSQKP